MGTSLECGKGCGRILSCSRYLAKHEMKCDGFPPLKCVCGKPFKDRHQKCRHRKTCADAIAHEAAKVAKAAGTSAPSSPPTPSTSKATANPTIDANVDVHSMVNSAIEANNTNNTTIININNYCATDIEQTVHEILRSPAFAQLIRDALDGDMKRKAKLF